MRLPSASITPQGDRVFTVRFSTVLHPPDETVTLHSAQTNWTEPLPGVFEDGAWLFRVEGDGPFEFKFVLEGYVWMEGANLTVPGVGGAEYPFDDDDVVFRQPSAVVTENGRVQQLVFRPDHDEQKVYDVIVVGSGMGGGLLADQLADAGASVLVLEAGSYLFPTHVGNLPRRLPLGVFDKNVWGLWEDFRVVNYVNAPNSFFAGGQAFNLGGRTVFWGGLIPRMGAWELVDWPAAVRDYLLTVGYRRAEDNLNRNGPLGSPYQERAKARLSELMPGFAHFDAPVAVQYQGYTPSSIPGGMFSTADLLTEDRLIDTGGRAKPTINLNHAVQRVLHGGGRARGVVCWDLLGRRERRYTGNVVVLCAGTIESAKIALQSALADPAGLIGKGITDHPIAYTHFSLPPDRPLAASDASAKVWSRHEQASRAAHPYNVVVELGADFNQGRYVDPDHLAEHRRLKGDATLCEIVFLFDSALVENNSVTLDGPPAVPVTVNVQPAPIAQNVWAEVQQIKTAVLDGLDAEPLTGENLDLTVAGLGGVAHEVGTLRMADDGHGVVDENLKFLAYDNLYACDNSVFASSPAANPTLTLAALALRLAEHLT